MEQVTISSTETVVVGTDTSVTIVTGLIGPKGKDGTLSAMSDVDITNIKEGSLLVYSTNVSKWQAGNMLNNQIMEAGQF